MTNITMTPKQQRFVDEYLQDLNATQAAIRAGYARSGASVEGTRLLANAKVAAAVAAAQAKRSERTEVTQDYVLGGILATIEECRGEDHRNPQAALKGLELLGRHLAMFTDKTINKHWVENLTDEEIDAELAKYGYSQTTPRSTH